MISTIRNQTYKLEFKSSYAKSIFGKEDINDILDQRQEESEKVYSSNINLRCESEDKIHLNQTLEINCSIKNNGNLNLKNIEVCLENQCSIIDLPIMQEKHIIFQKNFDKEGHNTFLVVAKNDDISRSYKLNVLALDKPSILIKNIKSPEKVDFEESFFVEFEIEKDSFAIPKNVEIIMVINSIEQKWSLDELDSTRLYKFRIKGSDLKLNSNIIRILVRYNDHIDTYKTEDKVIIMLNEPSFIQKIMIFLNQISHKINNLFS